GWLASSRRLCSRGWVAMVMLIIVALFLAVEVAYITPQIRSLRTAMEALYGSVSAAPEGGTMRSAFGKWHGISMIVALLRMLLGLGAFLFAGMAKWNFR